MRSAEKSFSASSTSLPRRRRVGIRSPRRLSANAGEALGNIRQENHSRSSRYGAQNFRRGCPPPFMPCPTTRRRCRIDADLARGTRFSHQGTHRDQHSPEHGSAPVSLAVVTGRPTRPCTASCCFANATRNPGLWPTSPGGPPKASPTATSSAASNATSPTKYSHCSPRIPPSRYLSDRGFNNAVKPSESSSLRRPNNSTFPTNAHAYLILHNVLTPIWKSPSAHGSATKLNNPIQHKKLLDISRGIPSGDVTLLGFS